MQHAVFFYSGQYSSLLVHILYQRNPFHTQILNFIRPVLLLSRVEVTVDGIGVVIGFMEHLRTVTDVTKAL
jgi:hypothetical protein